MTTVTGPRRAALTLAALALMGGLGLHIAPEARGDSISVVSAVSPRYAHSAVWDDRTSADCPRGCAYILGGLDAINNVVAEIVRLNPANVSLTPMRSRLASAYSAAVWTGTHAYLFGGLGAAAIQRYEPANDTLELLGAALPFSFSSGTAVWDGRDRPFDGCPGGCAYLFVGTDIWQFNPASSGLDRTNASLPRSAGGSVAVWDARDRPSVGCPGGCAYVLGGEATLGAESAILRFNPDTGDVTRLNASLPSGRAFMSGVWTGRYAFLFGGQYVRPDGVTDNTGEILVFDADRGSVRVAGVSLSSPAIFTAAVWSGSSAFIIAGNVGGGVGVIGDIVHYDPGIPRAVIAAVPPAECVNGQGRVVLSGLGSRDPDGTSLAYAWTAPGAQFDLPSSVITRAWFPFGSTNASLTVSDGVFEDAARTEVRVVDTVLPQVALLQPRSGKLYVNDWYEIHVGERDPLPRIAAIGPGTVRADATDACGLQGVEFRASDGSGLNDTEPPYEFRADPAMPFAGTMKVTAEAIDLGGNRVNTTVEFFQVALRQDACRDVFSALVCSALPQVGGLQKPTELPLEELRAACLLAFASRVCGEVFGP